MSERKVKVGIVGCGKIARVHATSLVNLDEADFVAVCDMDGERAKAFADQYGVPQVYTDMHQMLHSGEVEAIMCCTPHPIHERVVVAAAEAGVHVLCEKPMAITLDEADRMIAAADQAGIAFGVIFQRRWWPAAQRIRAAIDAGQLGKLTLGECAVKIWRSEEYFASDPWRGKWATEGGGVLMNQAVHAIDQFAWFMGKPVEVVGRYATLRHGNYIDVEDTAVATVVFEDGGLGTIQAASTFQPGFGFRVAVHGDNGASASVWERNEGEQGITDVWTIVGEEDQMAGWLEAESGGIGFPGFHAQQIQDFLQAVRDGRQPAVTGRDARTSLAIILAIYESSRTGQPVKL
jgi:UDP-N-acetyl-2-amino-2-deoxyglucuronate dehydrogenase